MSLPSPQITKDQILKALKELGEELKNNQITGEILLTGGAAMCLVYETRHSTEDVDALYKPKSIIDEIATNIAIRNQLPLNWLNDDVKRTIISEPQKELFLTMEGLKIYNVTPEYLLVMKLNAMRTNSMDHEDVINLLKHLNINSSAEAEKTISICFPNKNIPWTTKEILKDIFQDINLNKENQSLPTTNKLEPTLTDNNTPTPKDIIKNFSINCKDKGTEERYIEALKSLTLNFNYIHDNITRKEIPDFLQQMATKGKISYNKLTQIYARITEAYNLTSNIQPN